MASTGLTQRRRSAYASRMAAKRRRQKIFVAIGLVVLAALFAYEIPHTIKLLRGSSNPASSSTVAAATTPTTQQHKIPKRFTSSGDPFAARSLPNADPQMGAESGGHDPFAALSAANSAPAAPAPVVRSPLPQQIVVGTPGPNRTAVRGWIVILASIPTGQGRQSAAGFARRATGHVGGLSLLNSSNRKPLRGGYWVVYKGPYKTLAQVSAAANTVHAAGYGTAYIRELIVYR
jgi:hypothetical protein